MWVCVCVCVLITDHSRLWCVAPWTQEVRLHRVNLWLKSKYHINLVQHTHTLTNTQLFTGICHYCGDYRCSLLPPDSRRLTFALPNSVHMCHTGVPRLTQQWMRIFTTRAEGGKKKKSQNLCGAEILPWWLTEQRTGEKKQRTGCHCVVPQIHFQYPPFGWGRDVCVEVFFFPWFRKKKKKKNRRKK